MCKHGGSRPVCRPKSRKRFELPWKTPGEIGGTITEIDDLSMEPVEINTVTLQVMRLTKKSSGKRASSEYVAVVSRKTKKGKIVQVIPVGQIPPKQDITVQLDGTLVEVRFRRDVDFLQGKTLFCYALQEGEREKKQLRLLG